MNIIIFGTGGHAKVVLDAARAAQHNICGVVDDRWSLPIWRDVPHLGNRLNLPDIVGKYLNAAWIVAIGDAGIRREVVTQLEKLGVVFAVVIHPTAVLGTGVQVGSGSIVMAGTILQADVHVGRHAIINTASTVDHDCQISDYVHLSPGVHLAGNVCVEEAAHLGIGACSIPGVRIGRYSTVGAGAVVIEDIPSDVVAVGCPAKIIKRKEKNDAN
ncbi:acetyltransferase [Paenibacillus taichungensis]|uniref:acetyltransferase n=1 Tax=Paenibacillus taichungensis TaxID=484184 RepID=UPI002DB95553|nr:acetyltransferase [Paenibacillus taichungensis]MEC0106220.1 acetyltransferase [Paenibacillus taichungensis]MEC0199359.1 acetyltransferase [Paenibacillus taichungensis]